MTSGRAVTVAIQGCCHGELTSIYESLAPNTDLLLICGDFQAIRCRTDLCLMSVPPKHRRMGDFHEYYAGTKTAPVTTVFIGGNHECSLYLAELAYGGWVAPNIYHVGKFGAFWFKGLHIAGWSGIYNKTSFTANVVDEYALPYSPGSIRKVYHHSPKSFLKMCLLNHTLDVVLSHDWPMGIEQYGNVRALLRQKPFFRAEVEANALGSPLNMFLLQWLRPRFWFSAHLHVRFEAKVHWQKEGGACDVKGESRGSLGHGSGRQENAEEGSKTDGSPRHTKRSPTDELPTDMDDDGEMPKYDEMFSEGEEVPSNSDRLKTDNNDSGELPIDMDDDGDFLTNETNTHVPLDADGETFNADELPIDMDDDRKFPTKKNNADELPDADRKPVDADELSINMDAVETLISVKDKTGKGSPHTSISSINYETTTFLESFSRSTDPPRLTRKDTLTEPTRFLALDKCGYRRHALETLHIPIRPENINHPSVSSNNIYSSVRAIAINKVVELYVQNHMDAFRDINMEQIIDDPSLFVLVHELLPLVEHQVELLQKQRKAHSFAIHDSEFSPICPTSEQENVPLQFWPNPQTDKYCREYGVARPQLRFDPAACARVARQVRAETAESAAGKRNGRAHLIQKRPRPHRKR